MARELTFSDPGEGISEGEIVEVLVSSGDEVAEGDDVLLVETDKATTEVASPYSGTVEDIPVSAGDVVTVGDVLMRFAGGEEEAGTEDPGEPGDVGEPEETGDGGGKAAAVGELPEAEDDKQETKAKHDEKAEHDDGDRGREAGEGTPVPASPATRRLARELDVDLAQVQPSGAHGRVTSDDVRAAAGEAPEAAPEEERLVEEAQPAEERRAMPDLSRWGPVERVPLRGVRRATAKGVATAWRQIPHVTHHDVVDITELERWRRTQTDRAEEAGGDLSIMILAMKALVGVLRRHPRFNASLDPDADEIVLKHHFHLGVAVDTEDGLLVPVVRDVDRISLLELAVQVSELVQRTRDRDLDADEMQGGTFTVSNVGPLGGTAFTPIVNHPEVAILGMARARLEQVVTGDLDRPQTDVRLMLPLSLSYDHRVNDGADAARFVADLGDALADPEALLLHL